MGYDTQVEVKGFVPRWLRQRLRAGWEEPQPRIEPMRAAVMFADIAGFSAMTREFSARGDAGLEQLTTAVSDYFGRLFDHVTAAGGDIENTYGDGFLAFWEAGENEIATAARKASLCASELTSNFDRFRIGDGSEFRLRAAVLEGHIFAIKAGGADGHWLFFLGGDCLSEISHLLSTAKPGGVALSSAIQGAAADLSRMTASPRDGRGAQSDTGTLTAAISNSQVFPFLPRALRRAGRLTEGWLAEFRLISVLFVRFPELHCRRTVDLQHIQSVVAKVQETVDHYDGNTLRVSMNDKGPFILCAFGLPQNAHEDDPQRAEAAARELDAEFRTAGVAARCVVTEGVTYCGMVGRGAHYSYTTMGEAVNRAAKHVAVSDEPELLIDRRTGSIGTVPVVLPADEAFAAAGWQKSGRLIGRETELSWLAERIKALVAGTADCAILITGEAGIGKTTVLREMTRRATDVTVLRSAADSVVGSTTPYAIWRKLFGTLFADDGPAGSVQFTDALRRRLVRQGQDSGLVDLAGTVLQLAPSGVDAGRFSPTDRARLTRSVLVALMNDRLSTSPAVLLLEDAHWMDAASWALTSEVVKHVRRALIILASRPLDDFEQYLPGDDVEQLLLLPMNEEETQNILADALGCSGVSADVVNLVHGKAAGNPLFTTQLGLALLEARVLAIDNGRLRFGNRPHEKSSMLSDTVQRVIVSRVDRLPAFIQHTLKAASVVGKSFDLDIVQALISEDDVAGHLDLLAGLGLVRRVPGEGEGRFQFNHGVTREVMYRQMAFAQRRRLHELAAKALELMEIRPADAILGHHWLNAELADRAIPYWERAGYAAFTAGAFAEAAASFDQALACMSGMPSGVGRAARTARLFRHAGEAYLQIGNISVSRHYLVQALAALDRRWPTGSVATIAALSREMVQQFLIEFVFRRASNGIVVQEADREAAQVYESLGQVLGHSSELNLMGLSTLAALNMSQRTGSKQIYSRACGLFALVLLLMPVPAVARRYFEHSIDARPAQSEQPHDWLMTTEYLAIYSMTVADFDAAEAELLEMLEVGKSADNRRRRLDAMSLLSITYMCKGEFGRCERMLATFEHEVLNEKDPQVLGWAHLERAELALMRGDVESALRQIEGCKDLLPTLGPNERLWGEGLKALALWRHSRRDEALAAASAASNLLKSPNEIAFWAEGGVFAAAEVYIEALGATKTAKWNRAIASDAQRMMKRLRKFGVRLPISRPRTLMLLGCYELALDHQRQGISFFRRAREEASRQRRPYEEALAILQLAAASRKDFPLREKAFRSLREMGAEGLLDYLPHGHSVTPT